METTTKTLITVEASVNVPVAKAWSIWTNPADIKQWNTASPDWHTTSAENNLSVGGKFLSRMEAKDGSFGFDFWGIYDAITPNEYIEYTMGDGRKCQITFTNNGDSTHISSTFEAENENSVEMQKGGWQAIMDNYKAYAESK
jgi:uncharacterized protein YndB with AHSA1/START domain